MRDPNRIKVVLDLFEKIWKAYPDQRFAQLLWAIRYLEDAPVTDQGMLVDLRMLDPYYVEDDVLIKKLKTFIKEQGIE